MRIYVYIYILFLLLLKNKNPPLDSQSSPEGYSNFKPRLSVCLITVIDVFTRESRLADVNCLSQSRGSQETYGLKVIKVASK